MCSVKLHQRVVICGFQCTKQGHAPNFSKTRPDRDRKEDVPGETRKYGDHMLAALC